MAVRERNGRWQADATWKGKRARASFDTKGEADVWAAQALADLMAGREPTVPGRAGTSRAPGVTLAEAIRWCEEHRWARAKSLDRLTIAATQAARFFGPDAPVEGLRTSDLQRLGTALLNRGLSGARVNRIMSALSAVFRAHAERTDWRYTPPRFPPRQREGSGRTAVLDAEDVLRICDWLRTYGNTEEADAVVLLFETGMRLGELETLRWADLTWDQGQGRHTFALLRDTKNGVNRTVPLTHRASEVLARRRAEGAKVGADFARTSRIFPALRTWHLRRCFAKACEHLGLEGDDLCLHTLRHACGTRLMKAGVHPLAIQKWMGHKTLAMVSRYSRVRPDDLAEAAELLA